MLQKILKSKTMIFAMALGVLGAVQASLDVFTPYLSAQAMGFVTMAIGMAVAVLRVLTTMPLEDK